MRNEAEHRGRIRRSLSLRWRDCDQARYWRELSLAPAYDLVSTTVYPELTTAMGLYVGEKKRLETVERADFVELGHSMGLSRRAAETRIDMLRDRIVAAFEAQAADGVDSEIARAIVHQSKKRIEKLAVA